MSPNQRMMRRQPPAPPATSRPALGFALTSNFLALHLAMAASTVLLHHPTANRPHSKPHRPCTLQPPHGEGVGCAACS